MMVATTVRRRTRRKVNPDPVRKVNPDRNKRKYGTDQAPDSYDAFLGVKLATGTKDRDGWVGAEVLNNMTEDTRARLREREPNRSRQVKAMLTFAAEHPDFHAWMVERMPTPEGDGLELFRPRTRRTRRTVA